MNRSCYKVYSQYPSKTGYVDKQEHWRYSSARNYLGMEGLIDIDRK